MRAARFAAGLLLIIERMPATPAALHFAALLKISQAANFG
jgi:hypothetical protein